jgi:hypothetical protein
MLDSSFMLGRVISHYRIVETIGVAGWAWYSRPRTFVALKFGASPAATQRFSSGKVSGWLVDVLCVALYGGVLRRSLWQHARCEMRGHHRAEDGRGEHQYEDYIQQLAINQALARAV